MAASGQAKRHQSNSDQGAHWGRHGKSLPHGVHGSPQLEARPGVSCILLDRAAHSSDFGNTRVGADPNALSPASDFTSADQKPVGPIRHQTRSNVSRRAAGSSASPVISVMEAVRRLSSRTTAPASRTPSKLPATGPRDGGPRRSGGRRSCRSSRLQPRLSVPGGSEPRAAQRRPNRTRRSGRL